MADQEQGSSSSTSTSRDIKSLDSSGTHLTKDTPQHESSHMTKPDESIKTGPDDPPYNKNEVRVESEKKTKVTWKSNASLYCPKNGFPHSMVQELTLQKCPACGQDLYKRQRTVEVEDPNSKDGSVENISYEIEYRDSKGYWLGREERPSLLDLNEARKGVVADGKAGVMKVISVLWTSHMGDKNRGPGETRFIMDDGILENPRIAVTPHGTRIEIYSQRFITLLRKLVKYYPGVTFDVKNLSFYEPYRVIVYNLKEIEAFQATFQESDGPGPEGTTPGTDLLGKCDKETYDHIESILGFAKEHVWKGKIAEEEERLAQKIPVATFSMLWLIYKPGTTVYIESDGRLAAYVIQSVTVDPAVLSLPPEKLDPYELHAWYLDYDGKYVRRFQDNADGGEVRSRLHSEGEKWYKLLHGGLVGYRGDTLETPKQNIEDRVVIDCTSYWEQDDLEEKQKHTDKKKKKDGSDDSDNESDQTEMKPQLVEDFGFGLALCPCPTCLGLRPHPPPGFIWTKYDLIDPSNETTLELSDGPEEDIKHRYLLCSKRLMGFALKSRSWHILDVANCGDPKINKKAIDTLVMPDERKKMIKALVHRYTTQAGPGKGIHRAWQADFIESKGDGRLYVAHFLRISILFGLSREIENGFYGNNDFKCIAEFTGRPLLSLTCGDLGNDETEIERQLSRWFKLAERWGAVMLLDEADVYTERRQITDLKRNTMVSGESLAELIVIHYKDLDETDRKKIWKRFFQKLKDDRKDDIKIDSDTKDYVLDNSKMQKINWNGREIRNAFQTAVALAEYEFNVKEEKEPGEKPVLKQEHFEEVCGMSLEFKNYLKKTHGNMDENQRAALQKSRARTDGLDEVEV
ncbi:P-loop containing nucleoside triphosphate hydrolase protein [Whalleya microplaca]|nr:P-loop containing nucleoside triphosphate hydrolase protein [Whalleya microplaca]